MNLTETAAAHRLLDPLQPTCQVPDFDTGRECAQPATYICWLTTADGYASARLLYCFAHYYAAAQHFLHCRGCRDGYGYVLQAVAL